MSDTPLVADVVEQSLPEWGRMDVSQAVAFTAGNFVSLLQFFAWELGIDDDDAVRRSTMSLMEGLYFKPGTCPELEKKC